MSPCHIYPNIQLCEVIYICVFKSSAAGKTILTTKIEKLSFYEKHIQNKPF